MTPQNSHVLWRDWKSANASFPGSGYPPENGAGSFNLPVDNCGGYGSGGLNVQAYDPAADQWSNVLYYNAACL